MDHKQHTKAIGKKLGQVAMADRLGVTRPAVNMAVQRGQFPAAWYLAMCEMCSNADIACPPHLFNFKGVEPQRADA